MQKSRNEEKSKIQTLKFTSKFQNLKSKFHSGITLIALVVTIVVLLILAGVTITLMFGDNNIFDLAKDAAEKTNEAIKSDQAQLDELNKWLTENGWSSSNGGSGETPEEPDTPTPEVLEVGSTVSYNPSGTYKWKATYCSSTNKTPGTDTELNDDVVLNSGETNFNISTWKVLSIDETNKKVTLVPSTPTTGTVYLDEAQVYNNGAKLLNGACRNLYGNEAKGITARSIKIEDIEDHMTDTAKTGTNGAHKFVSSNGTEYDNQIANPYTTSKTYPVIYGKEQRAVINGITPTEATLGLSDEPNNFIERTENGASYGKLTAKTSIQPYQTYWYKNATFMQTAFETYKEGSTYYSLIMPQGTTTTYWVASRCVDISSDYCYFKVRNVKSGSIDAYSMCDSRGDNYSGKPLALFPVVTLSSELIETGKNGNFSVNLSE